MRRLRGQGFDTGRPSLGFSFLGCLPEIEIGAPPRNRHHSAHQIHIISLCQRFHYILSFIIRIHLVTNNDTRKVGQP